VDEKCPECGHPYLVEKNLKSGPVIACPNKRAEEEEPQAKRGRKKKSGEPAPALVKCDYSRPAAPTAVA